VTALALAGATTIVAAMATDTWQATRTAVTRLFRRGGSEEQATVEAQLEGNAALLADTEDTEQARRALVQVWQLHLRALLRAHPDAADELRTLVAQARAGLPGERQAWVQHVVAHAGVAAGAMGDGSSVNVHYHAGPEDVRPPVPGDPRPDGYGR
jgi:hypothetical protein